MKMRTYTRDEVKALLERAVELQARVERDGGDRDGLTLHELEEVASASGIDPALLRRAAAELDASDRTERDRAEMSSTHVHAERWVGVEMQDAVWEEVVLELRRRYDTSSGALMGAPGYGRGRIETIGRAREWIHVSMSGIETRAMLRPVGEGVQLSLRQRVGMMAPIGDALCIGGLVALIGFGAGFLVPGPGWVPVLIALLTLAAATAIAYPLDVMWRKRKMHELNDLADDLAERCLDAGHRTGAPAIDSGESSPEPLLDREGLNETAEEWAGETTSTAQPQRRAETSR